MKTFSLKGAILIAAALLAVGCRNANNTQEPVQPEPQPAQQEEVATSFDFNAMSPDTIANFKDGEGFVVMKMAQAVPNRVMLCTIPAGSSVGEHAHEADMEVIYVQQGVATIALDGVEQTYAPGQVHYCPKGHSHTIANRGTEDLVIYNVVAAQ